MNSVNSLVTLRLRITYACDSRCIGCSSRIEGEKSGPEIPAQVWIGLLEDLTRRDILPETIYLEGGEPFQDRGKLKAILDGAPEEVLSRIIVISNASSSYDADVSKLREAKGVLFSIDGPPEINQAIGRANPFNAMDNIDSFGQAGIELGFKSTFRRSNHFLFPAIVEIAKSVGVSRIRFAEFHPLGAGCELFKTMGLDENSFRSLFMDFGDILNQEDGRMKFAFSSAIYGREDWLERLGMLPERVIYTPGAKQLIINADGEVVPGFQFDRRHSKGNIGQRSLFDIMQNVSVTGNEMNDKPEGILPNFIISVKSPEWDFGEFPF